MDGPTLEKGLFVKINALGLESMASVRMAYLAQNKLVPTVSSGPSEDPNRQIFQMDFTTYFGSYEPISDLQQKMIDAEMDKLNDVLLPEHDGFGSRHFYIKYSNDMSCYLIKDLGEGSGTFIKVEK